MQELFTIGTPAQLAWLAAVTASQAAAMTAKAPDLAVASCSEETPAASLLSRTVASE
jgi:hypothetical protein